jgi:hypothetical protein
VACLVEILAGRPVEVLAGPWRSWPARGGPGRPVEVLAEALGLVLSPEDRRRLAELLAAMD